MRHKVATTEELKPGQCKVVCLEGVNIAVFNIKGQLYAVEDSCTHMGAPLSTGFPGKATITCEWHGATFDLRTGEALSAPASLPVKVFPVYLNGSDIEVEL